MHALTMLDDRIVSIHQPCVRPIVRCKVNVDVQFWHYDSVSLVNEYALIEQLDWKAFNESGDLQAAVERYRERHGFYLEWILSDKIYRNCKNHHYCAGLGI